MRHLQLSAPLAVTVLCLALLGPLPCAAQTDPFGESWRWVHFTKGSGLPADQVMALHEADDGTLWVNYHWFTGFVWTKAVGSPDSRTGFSTLMEGYVRDGLVAGQGDRELLLVRKDSTTRLASPGFAAGSHAVLGPDSLLLGKGDGSLYLLEGGVVKPFEKIRGLRGKPVLALSRSPNGAVFANAGDGLYRFDGESWTRILPTGGRTLVFPATPMVVENHGGSGAAYVLLPIESRGIWTWDSTRKPRRLTSVTPYPRVVTLGLVPEGILTVHEDATVRLWDGSSMRRIASIESLGPKIRQLHVLSNGDLCVVGTDEVHLYRRSIRYWDFLSTPGHADWNSVNAILRTRGGSLWLGTRDGVIVIEPDGRRRSITRVDGRQLRSITGIGEDDRGNIWISSGADFFGAFRWDGKSWRYFPIDESRSGTLLHKIKADRGGGLWFLGIGEAFSLPGELQPGAFRLKDGVFERWDVRKGLLHGRVYDVGEGPDGSYWFALKSGISRWRPAATSGDTGRWRHWTPKDGLKPNEAFISCLAAGPDSTLWFGHPNGGGLGRIAADGTVSYLARADGLIDDAVMDIQFDETGNLWITTASGVSSLRGGTFLSYGENTGLVPARSTAVEPEADRVLVGTLGGGLAMLDRNHPRFPLPVVAVQPARTAGSETIFEWDVAAYRGEVPPGLILTRYRLEESPWSGWSTSRRASFTGLEPGERIFTVQAKGLFGDFDTAGTSSSFAVLPSLFFRPVVLYPGLVAIAGIAGLAATLLRRKRKYDLSIRESEERYRMITELMSDYAYLASFDRDGRLAIVWLTGSFTRLTGYEVAEARVPGFFEKLVYPDEEHAALELLERLKAGSPVEIERRIATKRGDELWTRNYAIPIIDRKSGIVTHLYGIARDVTQRKQDEDQLRRLATELSRTEEEERRRMANYLHDGISQSLIISKRKLEALRERREISVVIERTVAEVEEILQGTIDHSRTLTFELCPPILYDLGLAPALDWLGEQMKGTHGLNVRFSDDGKPKPLGRELRNTMYAGAREAFMNVVKHAAAAGVWIDLSRLDGEVVLAIEDDGAGFDSRNPARRVDAKGSGFGLRNLRERMVQLGGRFEIESTPGKGTRLTLAAPAVSDGEGAER